MKKSRLLGAGLIAVLLAFTSPVAAQTLLLNEVMHHPGENVFPESYVELYNPGTNGVNLTAWRFTDGLSFSFPSNTVVPPRGYLVVAADEASFKARYPGVSNFVAGWEPPLGSHIVLENAAGQKAAELRYATEGDWATRILTTNGFAAYGHFGWQWDAPHNGQGPSLELVNPALGPQQPLNWTSSLAPRGTPGLPNSRAATNTAPLITAVAHHPVVPKPAEPVTVSARLLDEQPWGISATVHYRNASVPDPAAFTAVPLLDDGAHNDGLAKDGFYAAILPAQPLGTVVEFYLEAADAEGNRRIYPAVRPTENSPRTANLLYQVEDNSYTGTQPLYRIIMTEMERAELYQIGRRCPESDSDAEMNATWITTDGQVADGSAIQVRYNASARNRGHGTRTMNPNNYHIDVPNDRDWKNQGGVNLNANYAHSQVLGSAIFRRLGVPVPISQAVQVRVNGTNLMATVGGNSFGAYAGNEQYNNDFLRRAFAADPGGNAYRGARNAVNCDPRFNAEANLAWYGTTFTIPAYTNAYLRENNLLTNDGGDVIDLLAVFNSQNGYLASNYVADVRRRINVEQWMRYMAINTLLNNDETCLANGTGDDYGLYRGLQDTRFVALPYDLDTVMGRGSSSTPPQHSIWRMAAIPAMDRFMKNPEFAPVYFRTLLELCEGPFSPAEMNPVIDQVLGDFVPQSARDNFKTYNAARVADVLNQFPRALTITHELSVQNGFPRTDRAQVTLSGTANALVTRAVLVNGNPVYWSGWEGLWAATVSLRPGINRVTVECLDQTGQAVESATLDVWYDDGNSRTVGGRITADTAWNPADGPFVISTALTVASGATLTIQPGTSVFLGAGVNLLVENGGRLLAEGNLSAPIWFGTAPGSGSAWGGIIVQGSGNSPETRISHAHLVGNGSVCIEVAGGTVKLDHLTFGTLTEQYLSLDGASFEVSDCHFPSPSSALELVHGTQGIKSGGRGIIRRCFFGTTIGYSDVIDFTGGNRPSPILQLYNNVFSGSSDDHLDLDGTDAWIEGNLFLHVHRNGAPDSSSAVSGGSNGSATSEITVINNLFYDCDNAMTAKQGNFYTMYHNTIVRTTRQGGQDFDSGVLNLRDTTPDQTTFGAGCYFEGNIVLDAEKLARNYDPAQSTVTFVNNVLPEPWPGPGTGNTVADPLFTYVPRLEETWFTNWAGAQLLRQWFTPRPGSPALNAGGVTIAGATPHLGVTLMDGPGPITASSDATFRIEMLRSGSGIPTGAWPEGSGYTHYRWQLDGGPWSDALPGGQTLQLTRLAPGQHRLQVSGQRDSGLFQDDPALGEDETVTAYTWEVDPAYVAPTPPRVRLNEILAANTRTLTNGATTPDLVELLNSSPTPVDLAGMGLSDDPLAPDKFRFPAGSPVLAPGAFLVVYADPASTAPGIHLGFALSASGDALYLTSATGELLDQVTFGLQVPDLSLGRAADGTWVLSEPTFGAANRALSLGDRSGVLINEWLADPLFMANNDFVELFNGSAQPVDISGCLLSDAEGSPALSLVPALSYLPPAGHALFIADGNPSQGADHLNFRLRSDSGTISFLAPDGRPIDVINYGPQTTDVSQGRSPSGASTLTSFTQPTPGTPNPGPHGGMTVVTNVSSRVLPLVSAGTTWKHDNSGTPRDASWYAPDFNDGAWPEGVAIFGFETQPSQYPWPFTTPIPPPSQPGGHITVYFRTQFTLDEDPGGATLVSTNYIDDGAVYYLNGARVGSLRMPNSVSYDTPASTQNNEGEPEILVLTNRLVRGLNVLAVELHQTGSSSTDVAFGMQANAVFYSTNIVTNIVGGIAVALNEISVNPPLSDSGEPDASDWIELINPSDVPADLADASLTDDPQAARKFIFPPGTAIGPRSRLVIRCNADAPISSDNTGFALGAKSGVVFLFGPPSGGGALVDSLTYGLQPRGFTLGRMPEGTGGWTLALPSRGTENTPAGLGAASNLSFNEWMADPASGPDWFEVRNSGSQPVSIGGFSFTDDLAAPALSRVPPLSFIGVGPHGFSEFIADGTPEAGADHVNFKLSRGGEQIGLYAPSGSLITAVNFGAQLTGVSQGRFPDGAETVLNFHSPSPGESNFLPLEHLVLNELLSHTDPPYEDAIEFLNTGSTTLVLDGWYLSDSPENLKKFRVPPNTRVAPGTFKVFYEYEFNASGGSSVPFTFNSAHGGRVYLSEASSAGELTGYRLVTEFGPAARGISFGRHTNSLGEIDFAATVTPTFGVENPASLEQFRTGTGAPNAAARVGPLVVNEIMAAPAPLPSGEPGYEFVELRNASVTTVDLFDPNAPTNTWKIKGGIDFTFPPAATLEAGASALVVAFDPILDPIALADFVSRYQVPAGLAIYGPYQGQLDNSGEVVELRRPDAPQLAPHPDAGFVPYITVDRVFYRTAAPWPAGADSSGASLQRLQPLDYGNEPLNWTVAAPTAGRPNTSNPADQNNDGLPDAWQTQYFGSIDNPDASPAEDPDRDGFNNAQEYLAGTNPIDPASLLAVSGLAPLDGGGWRVSFMAAPGKTYTVLVTGDAGSASWQRVADVPAQPGASQVTVEDPAGGSAARFYRVVTPVLP